MEKEEAPVASASAAVDIAGRFEGIQKEFAYGWAVGVGEPTRRLTVEIVEGAEVVALGEASQLHQGLRARNIGDGRYAFMIRLPAALFDGEPHVLRARDAKSGTLLQGEQVIARRDAAHGEIEGVSAGVLFGWLPGDGAGKPPLLEVQVDGKAVGSVQATLARPDIAANRIAESAHGFRFDLTPFLAQAGERSIAVVETASGKQITGSPFRLADRPAWGVLDTRGGIELGGWVVQTAPAADPAIIGVEIDGEVVAEVAADRLRADLRAIGVQALRCGFGYVLPARLYDGREHALRLRVKGTQVVLRGSSRKLRVDLRHGIDLVDERRVSGWILNAAGPESPVRMDVWVDGEKIDTVVADLARDDVAREVLKRPEGSVAAGFSIALPAPEQGWTKRVVRLTPHGHPESLNGRDLVLVPRHEAIREAEAAAASGKSLKWLMPGWIAELRKGYAASPVVHREVPVAVEADAATPVDVIVPVYKGIEETLACVRSVINTKDPVAFELVVVNDASPEPALSAALRGLAEHAGFTLLENPKNLGFVASVNRGMKLHPGRDVILLNSDTVVPSGDWVSRLRKAAYAQPGVATVTPFSNRATILSLPRNVVDNDLPEGSTADELDAICARENAGVTAEIPTAVGFCMYIRRAALEEAGLFDEERWAKGYGEENDFCLKSAAMGWKHFAACDVFVQHHGSVSFQGEKAERVRENLAVLNRLYPDYPLRVEEHLAADPLAAPRNRVVVELLRQRARRFLLHVTHKWGGGIDIYVRDLCRRLAAEGEATLILKPGERGAREIATPDGSLVLAYPAGAPVSEIAADLRKLGVWHVHFHQTIGLGEEVWEIPEALGVPFDYTVHDYYLGCPRINLLDDRGIFCDQPDLGACESCATHAPLHPEIQEDFDKAGSVAQWRELHARRLKGVRRIFAPSHDAEVRFRKFYDGLPIKVLPHPEEPFKLALKPVPKKGELRVAIIGAIGPHKGHDLLLRVAKLAKASSAPVRFVIVGYTCDDPAYRQLDNVEILGAYRSEELGSVLQAAGCSAALFLSPWPETFSYTLTEAWQAGLIPVVGPLGAQAERVKAVSQGVVLPEGFSAKDVLNAVLDLPRARSPRKPQGGAATVRYARIMSRYYELD